jgi:hypothetical protein
VLTESNFTISDHEENLNEFGVVKENSYADPPRTARSQRENSEPKEIKLPNFNRKRTFQTSIDDAKLIMIGGPSTLDDKSLKP